MSVMDLEIAKLARDNYLITGLREKVSLWTEEELLLVYNRLLAVYDSAYTENVDLKNKPKALKLFHKTISLMGLGHLAQFSDVMLDPQKAARIFSALDDKITARYGKGTAQRNRNIMKQEDIKYKKNPRQPIFTTTNVENIPPTNSDLSVSAAAPKWEVISQEKFIMGTPSNDIPCPNVIPVPPKGREIQRTPLRPSNGSSFVISPPNAFKTPSVIVSKPSISGKIIPVGSRIPRTPEGELQCDSGIDENLKSDTLPKGRQIPRTPTIVNTDIPTIMPIKGKELARTPVGNVSETNESNNTRETFDMPPKRMELSRTPVNVSSEIVESSNKRSTFDIPLKSNQLARTPTNDSIQANYISSNERSTFDITMNGNQLARTPTDTKNSSRSPDGGGTTVKSTNLTVENIIPKGRQLSRTPQNCDNSIDDNKTGLNSTYVQKEDSEERRDTFDVQLPISDTTYDVFEPPIQFCDEKPDLISPPSNFAMPSSSIVITKSKTSLTEIDRRGSYVNEKCSVSDRRETFTVESEQDRRGTFTVSTIHDDSIYQSLNKNYVGPIPIRKEKQQGFNNHTVVDETFTLNQTREKVVDETFTFNQTREKAVDETFTLNQTRERLNTDDMSFFDPLADETINSGRHSLMVKTLDNKSLPTAKKLDEKPLLTAYTPEMTDETQSKRVPVSKNCIPKGRKQLPRTPTGADDLIDLKNESSENGSSSFAIGDLTIEIFVKDKKRDTLQVDQRSESNSRGSIGALVKKMDSDIDTNSSSLSNTPQKCTPALNMETPVCSEMRNQDKKMGNLSKNILQKNIKNLLQDKLDTINDEDDSLNIFDKKSDNSSNSKDKKASSNIVSTEDKLQIIERKSEEKAIENKQLKNKTSKMNQCHDQNTTKIRNVMKHKDEDSLVDKPNKQESSKNLTTNQQENLQNNEKMLEENPIGTDKKHKEKENTNETKYPKEHKENKSNEREIVEKKTIKEIVEKKNEKSSDSKHIKEVKNDVNKNEKDLLDLAKISKNNGKMDLEDYINLHKKPTLKNFKIPKVSKQENVLENKRQEETKAQDKNKRPEETKAQDQTVQADSAITDKQNKDSNKKLQILMDSEIDKKLKKNEAESNLKIVKKSSREEKQILKDSEVDKNVKNNESESTLKIVKKSSKEKLKSALDILVDDLNDSSDFNDSLEIFPIKKSKIYKSNKKCEEVTEYKKGKAEKEKEMHKYVNDARGNELANDKESPKENDENSNKCYNKDKSKAKRELKTSKPKKESKTNNKNSKTTEVDKIIADKMQHLIEQPNVKNNQVSKNEVICNDILEPKTDIINNVLCLKKPRDSLGSILPTPMRELLRNDEDVYLENTRNQDLMTTPAITNILVKDESSESSSQVKSDDAHRNIHKTKSRGKGRKLNIDLQTEDIIDKSKVAIEPVEMKMDQNKDVISKTGKQNNEATGNNHDAEGDSSSSLLQLEKKKQRKPVQRRERNTRLSIDIIVKKKSDKENSLNESSQLELSLEESKLSKNLKECASKVSNSKENKKAPSIERRGRGKARVEIDHKDVEKVEANTMKKPVAKRGKNVPEVKLVESTQKDEQVANISIKPVTKRGRKVTEVQLEELAQPVEQVASISMKPVTKRGRKVTEVKLEEFTQLDQEASSTKKPVAKRGRKASEVQSEESKQELAITTKKPVVKRGRKVNDVQSEKPTQKVEQVASTSKTPVTKKGNKVTEVQLEKSTQQAEEVASTNLKPATKRGRKASKESSQQAEDVATTSSKTVTKRGRKTSEVQLEDSTHQALEVSSIGSKSVPKRGRKASEVQLEESTQQGSSKSTKPVIKRGRKATEESTLVNKVVLKQPSRGGKSRQNLDISAVSKVNKNTSLSNKPTPKGSRRASLINNSIINTSKLSETMNPKARRGRAAVLDEPNASEITNSKSNLESEASNGKPVRGRRNVKAKLEVDNSFNSVEKTPELQNKIRTGRKTVKEPELKSNLSSSVLDASIKINGDKQGKTVEEEVTDVKKEQNKPRGRTKQVKSILSDANESKTEMLIKKENQKLKVTKENKNIAMKENIKASTNNKRHISDSQSSPDKKRKVEKLPEKKSAAKNVDVKSEVLDTSTNLVKRRKACKKTLETSSVEDVKPVRGRKRAAKITDEECSPVKKGKIMKNAELKCDENVSVSAAVPSGRVSRKCKTAASTAIKDIAKDAADISLTKRKSRKT